MMEEENIARWAPSGVKHTSSKSYRKPANTLQPAMLPTTTTSTTECKELDISVETNAAIEVGFVVPVTYQNCA
jgi:hypothetical protein